MHDNFRINHIIFSLFQSTKPGLQELGANKEETDEVPDTPSFDGNQVQKHFNGWLCLVPSCLSIGDSRTNEGEMKAGLIKMGASLGECWKCAILRRLTWKGRSTYGRTYRSAYRRFCPGAPLQHVVWVASLSNRVIARKKFSFLFSSQLSRRFLADRLIGRLYTPWWGVMPSKKVLTVEVESHRRSKILSS